MIGTTTILFAVLAFAVADDYYSQSGACKLPPQPDIDWEKWSSKSIYKYKTILASVGSVPNSLSDGETANQSWKLVPKDWQMVISDDPPPHDELLQCISAEISGTEGSVSITLSGKSKTGEKQSLKMRTWENPEGDYESLLHPADIDNEQLEYALSRYREDKNSVVLPARSTAFLTDYKSYFMILECEMNANHGIWLFAPKRDIDVKETLHFVNQLRFYDGWNNAKLRQSACFDHK